MIPRTASVYIHRHNYPLGGTPAAWLPLLASLYLHFMHTLAPHKHTFSMNRRQVKWNSSEGAEHFFSKLDHCLDWQSGYQHTTRSSRGSIAPFSRNGISRPLFYAVFLPLWCSYFSGFCCWWHWPFLPYWVCRPCTFLHGHCKQSEVWMLGTRQ